MSYIFSINKLVIEAISGATFHSLFTFFKIIYSFAGGNYFYGITTKSPSILFPEFYSLWVELFVSFRFCDMLTADSIKSTVDLLSAVASFGSNNIFL